MRADISQALYDAFQLWQWFYPYDNPVTGNYFDQEWNVILAEEPYASEFGAVLAGAAHDVRAGGHRDLRVHRLPPGLPAGSGGHVA